MKRPAWLAGNVLVLSVASLLNDAASEMIAPLMPLFVTTVLGGTAFTLGWIEGAADSASSLLKLVSGRMVDRTGRHRPWILAGYGFAAGARLAIAFVTSGGQLFAARIVDRVGKGLRTTPRDALLAAAAPPGRRATVFGFHRGMDHAGAWIGALGAFALLAAGVEDLRRIFLWTAVPAVLTVGLLAVGLKEVAPTPSGDLPRLSPRPPARLVPILVALAVATVGRMGDALLLLRLTESGAAVVSLPLWWVGLNLVRSVSSVVLSPAADARSHRESVAAGWLLYALVYVLLAVFTEPLAVGLAFVAAGIAAGLSEGSERAMVAERVGADARGEGYGWYHLVAGLTALPGSAALGWTWLHLGAPVAFFTAAGLSALAAALLFRHRRRQPSAAGAHG